MMHLTVKNTVQDYEKFTYNNILNLYLGSWKYDPFLFFLSQLSSTVAFMQTYIISDV